ncbi:hypothetical protein C8Q80DRAFT_1135624 [Daedaleopsis nitida]|nr:hypothetical protein C8Q80DRAFT_1135624 [Daedaleopsis nitida]
MLSFSCMSLSVCVRVVSVSYPFSVHFLSSFSDPMNEEEGLERIPSGEHTPLRSASPPVGPATPKATPSTRRLARRPTEGYSRSVSPLTVPCNILLIPEPGHILGAGVSEASDTVTVLVSKYSFGQQRLLTLCTGAGGEWRGCITTVSRTRGRAQVYLRRALRRRPSSPCPARDSAGCGSSTRQGAAQRRTWVVLQHICSSSRAMHQSRASGPPLSAHPMRSSLMSLSE